MCARTLLTAGTSAGAGDRVVADMLRELPPVALEVLC